MRSSKDIEEAMERHADTVWRVTSLYFSEPADRQDIFQDVFLKYSLADEKEFADEEHVKAWMITVTRNACLDQLRVFSRKNVSLDNISEEIDLITQTDSSVQPGSLISEIEQAMRDLDDPPRTPVYLALYEGYTAPEIAAMINAPVNTVYSWIARGKERLKEALS